MRPYASLLMEEPAALVEHLHALMDQGFTAFKIGWGPFGRIDSRTDEAMVAAARAAVGPDAVLAVDAGGSDAHWQGRFKWALQRARMLADYDVAWFEEALPPDALEDYVALRAASPVPIAGGEVLTRRQGFAPYLRARAFDIVQPDTTKCGGLSEARRIGWQAEDHGIRLIPHGWNTAVGLAADLQLAASLPDTDMVEYKTGSAYIDDLTLDGFKLDGEGLLAIPNTPGLGMSIDWDAVARHSGGGRPLHA